jgi:hypothetical protein
MLLADYPESPFTAACRTLGLDRWWRRAFNMHG